MLVLSETNKRHLPAPLKLTVVHVTSRLLKNAYKVGAKTTCCGFPKDTSWLVQGLCDVFFGQN